MPSSSSFPLGPNPIWLTLFAKGHPLLLQTHLLGLGPDHSLLCDLPSSSSLTDLHIGLPCKGRTFIDGDIFEFESVIQELGGTFQTLRLGAPIKISKQPPRSFPRLAVNGLSGTVRPMSKTGYILAVIPIVFVNLSPTGCQFQVPATAWPEVSSILIQLSCRLPGLPHFSRIKGKVEWVQPLQNLTIGAQFIFDSEIHSAEKDLVHWFSSQQASLINTIA